MRYAFLLALALTACTKTPANEIPKDKWVDTMTSALPTMLCAPRGFFRSCFTQTEDECLAQALRSTKACLLKMEGEIPASLRQPEQGEEWGKKLGICAGETMEVSLAGEKKKIDNADCRDPGKWTE